MIDADALFRSSHEGICRLAVYLGLNPYGVPRRQLVLQILFRIL